MRWTGMAACLGVLSLAACGGSSFSAADGATDAGGNDAGAVGSRDGSADVAVDGAGPNDSSAAPEVGAGEAGSIDGAVTGGVPCGNSLSCSGTTPICCAGASFSCAHDQCGCETQLACASDADCSTTTPVCCIDNRQDPTCSSGHWVAKCATACLNGAQQLCDPSAQPPQCLNGLCSTDSGDLSNAGLPPNAGYGVCK